MNLDTHTTEQVEALIEATRNGEQEARNQLVELLIPVFRRHARALLRDAPSGLTMDSVGMVSELWLKLLRSYDFGKVVDPRHLLGLAARNMRQIMLDYLKARRRLKRPQAGNRAPEALAAGLEADVLSPEQATAIAEWVEAYAATDSAAAQAIDLMVFTGLPLEEAAAVLDVPPHRLRLKVAKAKRDFIETLRGSPADNA